MRRRTLLIGTLILATPAFAAKIPTTILLPVTEWHVELPSPLPTPTGIKGREIKGGDSCVFDGKGEKLDPQAAVERVLDSDVVYAGEQHDRVSHHQAQARLLSAMLSRRRSGAGFEMLHATKAQQDALDDYVAGAIDAAQFQKKVDWPKTWGYPFEWYRPIFEALQAHRAPGVALNVPRAIVHKVATSGLESLTSEERRFVPPGMARPDDPAYLAMLKDTFRQHAPDPNDTLAWDRYLDAMSLWNEGMASRVVEFLQKLPRTPLLVVAGGFHAVRAGIPESVARRAAAIRQTSVILVESKECPERLPADQLAPAADLFWLVAP